jgi:hypothetical protein
MIERLAWLTEGSKMEDSGLKNKAGITGMIMPMPSISIKTVKKMGRILPLLPLVAPCMVFGVILGQKYKKGINHLLTFAD